MHLEKITVWRGLWAGGIIGQYFFKDAENCNVTVNGEHLKQNRLTFMTCGFNKTVQYGEFGEYFISQSGPINWPPRSCD